MNRVTVAEAKRYLGLDGEEQNGLLAVFLNSAEHLVEKTLRRKIDKKTPEIARTAILFCIWQFYFHRDNAEFSQSKLEQTLGVMLSDIREVEF